MINTIDEVYKVFTVYRRKNGVERRNVARFACIDNQLHILEDHFGFLKHLKEGPISRGTLKDIEHMMHSMHTEVVAESDIQEGNRLDLTPEEDLGPAGDPVLPMAAGAGAPQTDAQAVLAAGQILPRMERPASVFEYKRLGMDNPSVVEFQGHKVLLNGHVLEHEEVERIIRNVKEGVATLRYKRNELPAHIQKMEAVFEELVKIEPQLADSLGQMRGAVKAGHLPKTALQSMTRALFTDTLVPKMGNVKAYGDFLSRPRTGGVHVRIDGNDFGQINKIHSFEHGNKAITAMGGAIREALDETVGSKHGKSFRIGGDEFHLFVPSHEHAANFARAVRAKLEKIPPVGGTHALSISMGWGHNPDHAEQALIKAKTAKKQANYPHGQAKTHAYSGIPGSEGHVPVHEDYVPKNFLPPKKADVAPPEAQPAAPSATTPVKPLGNATLSQPSLKP